MDAARPTPAANLTYLQRTHAPQHACPASSIQSLALLCHPSLHDPAKQGAAPNALTAPCKSATQTVHQALQQQHPSGMGCDAALTAEATPCFRVTVHITHHASLKVSSTASEICQLSTQLHTLRLQRLRKCGMYECMCMRGMWMSMRDLDLDVFAWRPWQSCSASSNVPYRAGALAWTREMYMLQVEVQ